MFNRLAARQIEDSRVLFDIKLAKNMELSENKGSAGTGE
jgi:hypothetical protein